MHVPVLLHEVLETLNPKPGEFFIDGTLGAGGHARAIIKKIGPTGTFLGVDRDPRAVVSLKAGEMTDGNVTLLSASYATLPELLISQKLGKADGVLLDLGTSSDQLDGSALGRGFSFKTDEPLLMTYSDDEPTVAQVLATISESELSEIIRTLGEEKYADKIAQAIISAEKEAPIVTTGRLAEVVRSAVPVSYERGRIHPATRTFQALRIYANHELEHLKLFLEALPKILKFGCANTTAEVCDRQKHIDRYE